MVTASDKQEVIARLRNSLAALEAGDSPAEHRSGSSNSQWDDFSLLEENSVSSYEKGKRETVSPFTSSPAKEKPSLQEKSADEAYQQILRWVSVRERSTAYLRSRLLKAEYSPQAIDEALAKACRVRVVDDRRYADALVRMTLAAGKGLSNVEREISELGIEPATLDAWKEHSELGREFDIERALTVLQRKPPRAKNQREAAFRRLISQGYGTDVASAAARLWAEQR